MAEAFSFEIDRYGIGVLTFDLPGEKVNKLTSDVMTQLDKLLNSFTGYADLKLLLIKSEKPGIFIAGADIAEIQDILDPDEGEKKAQLGQGILNKLSQLPVPTIAAISGATLGGGLEFALACTYRICSDGPRVQMGLPEVNLGIIPGFGGTQRLPRLIGLQQGLPMILSGKIVDSKKAFRVGLVDQVFPQAFFEERVMKFAKRIIEDETFSKQVLARRNHFKKGLMGFLLEGNMFGRALIFSKAKKTIMEKSKGQYPAPLAALKVVRQGLKRVLQSGLQLEAKAFSKLVPTDISKNLIQLFYTQEALKKDSGLKGSAARPKSLHRFGVLGAGLMGGGIAWLLTYRKGHVRMKDLNWEALRQGFQAARKIYNGFLKRRRIDRNRLSMLMNRLSGGLDYSGFDRHDMVIEAIVENMDVKKSVLADLENQVSEHTIIASNTSALSITELATSLKHPERFVGFHFFSPVNRMPLIEVIPGEKTSDETIVSAVQLAKELKKTPIVVKNCPGFLVNRILIPYVNEAVRLLEDGAKIDRVDRLMIKFGMPLGPLSLADEVGLDVGYKVAKELETGYGSRMHVPMSLEILHEKDGLLGKKTDKGFYLYNGLSTDKPVNKDIYSIITQDTSKKLSDDEIRDRLILIMVNEAARCLSEQIVVSPQYLDMAMILGTGFPPFLGGLCRYADSRGIPEVVDILKSFSSRLGERFTVAPLLLEMSEQGQTFYGGGS